VILLRRLSRPFYGWCKSLGRAPVSFRDASRIPPIRGMSAARNLLLRERPRMNSGSQRGAKRIGCNRFASRNSIYRVFTSLSRRFPIGGAASLRKFLGSGARNLVVSATRFLGAQNAPRNDKWAESRKGKIVRQIPIPDLQWRHTTFLSRQPVDRPLLGLWVGDYYFTTQFPRGIARWQIGAEITKTLRRAAGNNLRPGGHRPTAACPQSVS